MKEDGIKFGIYPLSVAGTPFGLTEGPNDNYKEIQGVMEGRKIIEELDLSIEIGFGSVPESLASTSEFWGNIYKVGGDEFIKAIDFVGHNFYIDVFEERELNINEEINDSVERTLKDLREKSFVKAKIPNSVTIRITENGWTTGENHITKITRTEEKQAEVLEKVIRKIYDLRKELNISHYELFGLRDADSTKKDIFHQYGIMKDDYTKKKRI